MTKFAMCKVSSQSVINPRRHEPNKITRKQKERGLIGLLSSTCDSVHPIDLIFGTYNYLSLYF